MIKIKVPRTEHKFTRYELDLVREALKDKAKRSSNEQDKMTCWLLFDRLKRELDDQRGT